MSANTSPLHYNDLEEAYITDANFKVDISQKMKVPHKISFNSETPLNGGNHAAWQENINMQVPERILVVGSDQHLGTKAPPREIVFDNSLLQQNDPYPSDPRVGTPPRTLTLDKYPFPGVEEFEEPMKDQLPVVKPKPKMYQDNLLNDSRIIGREITPPIGAGGDGLTTAEEVIHLRKQMAKLNRRVMALELENLGRLQKEKILYGLGIAYFLLKTIIWLNRSN
ncbi:transport and Golgi organization protein 11 [Onthophagus taurus]|uniref:transport and Golgi organization protein 11 n=1 Tax=Onthophagus taurus TaxID=166361 RepID=UPI000C203D72|nr:transport and Golgi organization protein 11 [Onthophagus taurus]